ncbi:MAG: hypothetical protein ABIZ91_05600 [Gemmatimonadaceae bacterium]
MKAQKAFVFVWLFTGVSATLGSIVGGALGRPFLFAGAILGGVLGVLGSVRLAAAWQWLAPESWRFAVLGGVLGFAIAAPIAVLNLDTPITPFFSCALAGAGALVGAGIARRR